MVWTVVALAVIGYCLGRAVQKYRIKKLISKQLRLQKEVELLNVRVNFYNPQP